VSFTRIGIYLAILVFIGLCVMDGIGFGTLTPVLVTAVVLVVLIAGGSWLNPHPHPAPRFENGPRPEEPPVTQTAQEPPTTQESQGAAGSEPAAPGGAAEAEESEGKSSGSP
jgi:hypothetical protein